MKNGQDRSHRNLGPITFGPNRSPRNRNPQEADNVLDDYHNFAGTPSNRLPLDPPSLWRLAILASDSARIPADGAENSPDPETGRPGVPSGYTYLLQLAAHDLVNTQPGGVADLGLPETIRNLQRVPLALETLFGAGPISCPYAYDMRQAPQDKTLAHLRLGRVRSAGGTEGDALDLPRMAFKDWQNKVKATSFETVLIPDTRNDDNMILGQLTALFHRIYNHFLVETAKIQGDFTEPQIEETARKLLVRLFRRILRQDLLARILHPDVHAGYLAMSKPTRNISKSTDSVSIEFAFAAARLGHAMVRGSYRMNKDETEVDLARVLSHSSRHRPQSLPLPEKYVADWDLFFPPADQTGPGINWALRFGPHVTAFMQNEAAAKTPGLEKGVVHYGTVIRDFLREATWQLKTPLELIEANWNGPAAAALRPYRGDDGKVDPQKVSRLFKDGLTALMGKTSPSKDKMAEKDIETWVRDPSLLLFLQFESAALGQNGARLGPLGSILIAEAMWPAFWPEDWETANAPLDRLETAVLGARPETMPALLAAWRLKTTTPTT